MNKFKELEVIGTVAPRKSDDINNSRWGVQFNLRQFDSMNDIDEMLEKINDSGVKWVRFSTGYNFHIPPEEGYFRWKEMDRIINRLTEHKINIFITIMNRGIDFQGPSGSGELDEYLNSVSAIVKRYGKTVKYWEIMNEPAITPVYIEAVRKASTIIKQIDSKAKVLAGSLKRQEFKNIKKLIDGAGSEIDIVTFHPYNEFPEAIKHRVIVPTNGGEGAYSISSMLFEEFQEQLGNERNRIELWNGEGGYPSSDHTESWKGRGPWGENIQAKWILRRFLVDYSLDVPVMIYFYLTESVPENNHKVNAKGLIVAKTGKPKKGYKALQHLTSVFDNRLNTPQEVQSKFEIVDEGGFSGVKGENEEKYLTENSPYEMEKSPIPIEVVALTGNEDAAITYWLPWRMQEYVNPAKVNLFIKNVNIKDPVLVDLLTGSVYRTKPEISGNGMLFKGLPLADYPMAILPKHLVKMGDIEK